MILGLFFVALTGCEDMNSVNQEYLDRGETTYIAKIDSVKSVVGLNKVWLKWWLTGDPRIAKTEVRWVEGIETKTKEYVIDRTQNDSLIIETILDIPAGSYTFEFINWDDKGNNRSISVTSAVEILGETFTSSFRNRQIAIATKFGNGYALVWGASDCLYSDFSYKTLSGETVSMRLPADSAEVTPQMLLYDYDGKGLTQKTYYLYDTPIFKEIIETQEEVFDYFNDVSVTLTASDISTAGPGHFDLGGESIGFHDSNASHDPGSGGANVRPNLGDFGSAAMDIEGDGGNIGYSNPGEWVQYTVYAQDEGYYEIDWYISVNSDGSACHIEVDGNVYEAYPLINNGSWSSWRYYCAVNGVLPPIIHFTKGKHTVRFQWDTGGFNYNGLKFRKVDPDNYIYPASRTGWTAESRNGNHPWGDPYGGTPELVLDGNRNTGWHSALGTPLPQCLVIDMKASRKVDHLVLWHLPEGIANNWIYYKTIEVYFSDTPVTPDEYQSSWGSPAAVYNYPGGIDPITINMEPNSQGQYMILFFPNSTSNTYISFMELDVYLKR
jgi:hypothetical protein